jgi:hypothetical protein
VSPDALMAPATEIWSALNLRQTWFPWNDCDHNPTGLAGGLKPRQEQGPSPGSTRSVSSNGSSNSVVDNEHDHSADDRDEHAVEIEACHPRGTEHRK